MSEYSYMCYFYLYAHLWIVFSLEMFINSHIFVASGILYNVLKSKQPINWIVTDDILTQNWNEKASLIGWVRFIIISHSLPHSNLAQHSRPLVADIAYAMWRRVVNNISNPDDKISMGISLKTTPENRTATDVIFATGVLVHLDKGYILVFLEVEED